MAARHAAKRCFLGNGISKIVSLENLKSLILMKLLSVRHLLVCGAVGLAFAACTPKKDPQLQQAAQIHNQAMAMHDEVMASVGGAKALLPRLKARRDSASAATRPALDSAIAGIERTDKRMDTWMAEVVEVPGNEEDGHAHHEHGKGGAHEHSHDAPPDVTPQQMLDIQREMKKNIEGIRDQAAGQTKAARKLLGEL